MQIESGGIRCVAFDAVGTLIQPVPAAAEVYHLVAQRHGSQLTGDEIARRFRKAFRETEQGNPAEPGERRLITSEDLERARWHAIVLSVIDDLADPEACFDELFAHFAIPSSWRMFDDTIDALERLRRAGVELLLASNFDQRLHSVCDGLPELQSVTCRVISSEVGYRKPSPKFFDALLKRAGCRRDELLMVGDDRDNDWEGARRSGIAAVLINRDRDRGPDENGSLMELVDRFSARESGKLKKRP